MSRRSLASRIGHVQQYAGTRLITLADGAERGVRVVEFRTASGLDFAVMVDRGMDIGWFRYRGRSLCWHAPTGFTSPALRELDAGLGWMRTFGGGMVVTGGLDHIGHPEVDPHDTYHEPARAEGTRYGIHGRVGITPARLTGHGESWSGDALRLFAEGEVVQANTMAEHLQLTRRVEVAAEGLAVTWTDTVENLGHESTPHMMLYHVNFGWPLLGSRTEVLLPSRGIRWSTHDEEADRAFARVPEPAAGFERHILEHELAARGGRVEVALVNRDDPQAPWGVVMNYEAKRFPYFVQWRMMAEGNYVLGLEPSTNGPDGRLAARERGELRILEPGESVRTSTTLTVLDGADACAATADRIAEAARPAAGNG